MTQVRSSNMQPNNHEQPHHPDLNPNHQPQNASPLSHYENTQVFSNLDTPLIPNVANNPANLNPTTLQHHQIDHANLYLAIFSLNLGNSSIPLTLVNSPDTTPLHPHQNVNPHLVPENASQGSHNEENVPKPSLRWTWVDDTGPHNKGIKNSNKI